MFSGDISQSKAPIRNDVGSKELTFEESGGSVSSTALKVLISEVAQLDASQRSNNSQRLKPTYRHERGNCKLKRSKSSSIEASQKNTLNRRPPLSLVTAGDSSSREAGSTYSLGRSSQSSDLTSSDTPGCSTSSQSPRNHLKLAALQPSEVSDREVQKANKAFRMQKKAVQRVNVRRELVYLYRNLKDELLLAAKSSKLRASWPESGKATEVELPQAKSADSFYGLMFRAAYNKVYFFHDDEGSLFTLLNLEKLYLKKEGSVAPNRCFEDIRQSIVSWLEDNPLFETDMGEMDYEESKLLAYLAERPFPETHVDKSPAEREALALLQRLYPVSSIHHPGPIKGLPMVDQGGGDSLPPAEIVKDDERFLPNIPPISFLITYERLIKAQQLFKLIEDAMVMPPKYMPRMQKLRLLNLCRTWCELYPHKRATGGVVRSAFVSLINACRRSKDKEVKKMAEELLLAYHAETINFVAPPRNHQTLNTGNFFAQILSGIYTKEEFEAFITGAAYDIKFMAAMRIFSMSPMDFLDEKKMCNKTVVSEFSTGLSTYVESCEELMKSLIAKFEAQRNEIIFNFVYMFVCLSDRLVKNHDFFSSFAIFNAISSKLITEVKSRKSKKKSLVDKEKEERCMVMLRYMGELFSGNNKFERLNEEIAVCKSNRVFYIPEISLIFRKSIQNREERKKLVQEFYDSKYEIETAKFLSWINDLLQGIKHHALMEMSNQTCYTNIGYEIFKSEWKINPQKVTVSPKE